MFYGCDFVILVFGSFVFAGFVMLLWVCYGWWFWRLGFVVCVLVWVVLGMGWLIACGIVCRLCKIGWFIRMLFLVLLIVLFFCGSFIEVFGLFVA